MSSRAKSRDLPNAEDVTRVGEVLRCAQGDTAVTVIVECGRQRIRERSTQTYTVARSIETSHPPLGGRPDEFVHLKLESDVEIISQDPFDDFARIDSAENWRKQYRVTLRRQIEARDFFA